jgi:hypothetical protein
VYVWHARRRGLVAKVAVGLPAASVAFSPDGGHLAVGGGNGALRVLSGRDWSHLQAEVKQVRAQGAVRVGRWLPAHVQAKGCWPRLEFAMGAYPLFTPWQAAMQRRTPHADVHTPLHPSLWPTLRRPAVGRHD